jgi:hypothetical protein
MRKLVFCALVATAASQAAGCIIVSDDAADGVITATLGISSAGGGAVTTRQGDGVRLNAMSLDGGPNFSDIFDPAPGVIQTGLLVGGDYDVWADYINDFEPGRLVVMEETNHVRVTVDGDIGASIDMVLSNGRIGLNWSISDPGGPVSSCSDVIGEDGVSVVTTLAGSQMFVDDVFDCEAGFNNPNPVLTDAVPIGNLTVAVSIINAQGASIGDAAPEPAVLQEGNEYLVGADALLVDIQVP